MWSRMPFTSLPDFRCLKTEVKMSCASFNVSFLTKVLIAIIISTVFIIIYLSGSTVTIRYSIVKVHVLFAYKTK